MKLTPEVAHAVQNLRNDERFKTFIRGVSDYGEETVHRMIHNKESRDECAGMALAITAILKVVNTAPEKLDQIVRSKQ